MANLLPQSFRDDVKTEYKLRLGSVGLTLLAVTLLSATVLLTPSFILTESRLEQNQATLDSLSEVSAATATKESKDIITNTNRKLSVVNKENNQLSPTDIVNLVTDTKPTGVSIRRISLQDPENKSEQSIELSGVARTRDSLLEFESRLQKQADVQQVDLPIETLAAKNNPEFFLTITIKQL